MNNQRRPARRKPSWLFAIMIVAVSTVVFALSDAIGNPARPDEPAFWCA